MLMESSLRVGMSEMRTPGNWFFSITVDGNEVASFRVELDTNKDVWLVSDRDGNVWKRSDKTAAMNTARLQIYATIATYLGC